jgi:hypothetical protein
MAHIQVAEEIQLARKVSPFKFVSWLQYMRCQIFSVVYFLYVTLPNVGTSYFSGNFILDG